MASATTIPTIIPASGAHIAADMLARIYPNDYVNGKMRRAARRRASPGLEVLGNRKRPEDS